MQKQHITLTEKDRIELEGLLLKTSLSVKMHRRICVLLLLDKAKSYSAVAKELTITYPAMHYPAMHYPAMHYPAMHYPAMHYPAMQKICAKYSQKASDSTALEYLSDKTRTGRPIAISGTERAKITALACSNAPEGHGGWTLRLLADKVVELGICPQISHSYVGKILKKTSYSPTLNAVGALDK